jgi:hypothetical protein
MTPNDDPLELLAQLAQTRDDRNLQERIAALLSTEGERFVAAMLPTLPPENEEREGPRAGHCVSRKTWQNYVGTQRAQPLKICRPKDLDGVKRSLLDAVALGCPLRAVGSHHAWSDAALTDGVVVETDELNRPLELDPSLLKNGADASDLFFVEGGITIKRLNEVLAEQDRGLINMGGYDGQTLAGVVSTSTHGSGLSLGSFSSFVEALIILRSDPSDSGKVLELQVERLNGISDPARFAAKYCGTRTLLQDDKVFNASVVGVGCLGIVYALVIRVRSKHWLLETRRITKWQSIKEQLHEGSILIDPNNLHFEVWINPHERDGDHTCLITSRGVTDKPSGPVHPKPFRSLFAQLLASLPGADRALTALFNNFPTLSPSLVEDALTSLKNEEGYVNVSHEILNIGKPNDFAAICSEFGVDLECHVDAADSLLQAAKHYVAQGDTYHCGAIVLRYVAASPGFLSMQPRPTCMIELPMLRDVFGADEMLWRYERILTSRYRARPHWGQRNFLTQALVRELYPQLDEWLDVFRWFNPDGRFHSRFTDRVGFSDHGP